MKPANRLANRLAWTLTVGLVAAGRPLAAPVQVDPAFGYRIGDSVVATGRVTVDDAARLDPQSLPQPGRVNGWLDLLEVRVVTEPGARRIVRSFQVTASDAQPRVLFLPKAELKFLLGGREITEQLESLPISVSPLTSREPVLRTGFGALRPDRDVPPAEPAASLRRVQWLAAALASLVLLWLAVRNLAMRRPGFAPFGSAARQVRRLARARRSDPDALRTALRIMHDAFNETAGRAVFASQCAAFLATHPQFAAEAAAVQSFFDRSNRVFFAGPQAEDGARTGADGKAEPSEPAELADLVELARTLARLERPGR